MNNYKYFHGERNNYYFGKLMAVRDFENEQAYFNNKRRLSNRLLNGVGIVSGLDVLLVDKQTVSIEMGMAIDYLGREIVVKAPIIRKIRVIDGFEENRDKKKLYLCIEYAEAFKETTFSAASSVKGSDVGKEYNRIEEGYHLFVTSREPEDSAIRLSALAYTEAELFNDKGVAIKITLPKYANPGIPVKMSVTFDKTDLNLPADYNIKINSKMFKSLSGGEINISYTEVGIETDKHIVADYYLICDATSPTIGEVEINAKDVVVTIGNQEYTGEKDFNIPINIITGSIRDSVIDGYYSIGFDDVMDFDPTQHIYLASFDLVASRSTYFVQSFKAHPFKQYVLNNELLNVLGNIAYDAQIVHNACSPDSERSIPQQSVIMRNDSEIKLATDSVQVKLGFAPKVGKTYMSPDIVHGLGTGNVSVELAVEGMERDSNNAPSVLIFGDSDIFAESTAAKIKAAAAVYPEKGTMRIGVKLLSATNLATITVRWWAYKKIGEKRPLSETSTDGISVSINPSSIQIPPMEQVRFSASISGMLNQEVSWKVTDTGGGTIDANGLYTAPAKEGVYAITATSSKYEDKFSTAYVVVKA